MSWKSAGLPRRLLVANRGEIACRIFRTARRLGIETIAVYSDADVTARHVRLADRAERVGPASARESYLDKDALIAAARRSGAEAIHPGYGFLSENDEFATACEAAGLVFVGPPAAAIRAMGSKATAKRLLESSGVPLTPGYHGEAQDHTTLLREADRIGYPLLIKASAGGGGKGIRRVDRREAFLDALASCQRESASSFGDPHVLLERCIERPRHIEIQIFADGHGNVIHLGERDCSVQRRHQKVLEEAPAPGVTPERRRAMGEAAVAAARRVGYVGAGTVEFIVDTDGQFYFMEMNTRLQVEHPVTEMVTGIDLVEWQLRIAAGEPLPRRQDEITLAGHAIEVRIYAEDPARGFLPSPGTLLAWCPPPPSEGVRVDAGIDAGDVITPFYDAMIAKLIVHGTTREYALGKLAGALRETFAAGPETNLPFLRRLVETPSIRDADLDTHLIEREQTALFDAQREVHHDLLLAAIALRLLKGMAETVSLTSSPRQADTLDPNPWSARDGFRLIGRGRQRLTLECAERRYEASIEYLPVGWLITMAERTITLRARRAEDGRLELWIDEQRHYAFASMRDEIVTVQIAGLHAVVRLIDPRHSAVEEDAINGGLRSPMPGRIVAVHVAAGDRVKRGAPLLAVEAMKMEHALTAPADGVVERVHVTPGTQVAEAITLVDFKPD